MNFVCFGMLCVVLWEFGLVGFWLSYCFASYVGCCIGFGVLIDCCGVVFVCFWWVFGFLFLVFLVGLGVCVC